MLLFKQIKMGQKQVSNKDSNTHLTSNTKFSGGSIENQRLVWFPIGGSSEDVEDKTSTFGTVLGYSLEDITPTPRSFFDQSSADPSNHPYKPFPKNRVLKIENITCSEFVGCGEIAQVVATPSKVYILEKSRGVVFVLANKKFSLLPLCENVEFGKTKSIIAISAYTDHALFLVHDRTLDCTFIYGEGSNSYQQLNNGDGQTNKPLFCPSKEVGSGHEVTHIGCSFSFSTCIINNHDIHLSGQNWLTSSSVAGYHSWKTKLYTCKKPVKSLHCGNFHLVAILDDHSLIVAGSNSSGQLISKSINASFFEVPMSEMTAIYAKLGSNSCLFETAQHEYYAFGSVSTD